MIQQHVSHKLRVGFTEASDDGGWPFNSFWLAVASSMVPNLFNKSFNFSLFLLFGFCRRIIFVVVITLVIRERDTSLMLLLMGTSGRRQSREKERESRQGTLRY